MYRTLENLKKINQLAAELKKYSHGDRTQYDNRQQVSEDVIRDRELNEYLEKQSEQEKNN